MSFRLPSLREKSFRFALILAATLPAFAAEAPAPKAPVATVALIRNLAESGALKPEAAAALIAQAEADAAAQAEAIRTAVAAALAAQQTSAPRPADAVPAPAPEGTVRVTYIPAPVRAQMMEEIRHEVLAQAAAENWAAPRAFPDWVGRFRLFGDTRVRYEGSYFPAGNDNTGAFPNFNAINTGAPFDITGSAFSPQLNVDQDRARVRLRARLGFAMDLEEGFTSGLRLATGENGSPVSTNQSLGLAGSGQGGQFSKYAVWLDRAFVRYDRPGAPGRTLAFTAGRFDNPFFSTDVMWDDDIGLDGVAVQGRVPASDTLTPFFAAGVFPVFNTDFNFASIQPAKFRSTDKWLYAAQLGADWQASGDTNLKVAVALYDFEGVEGKLSSPFTPTTAADQGDTDSRRPSFAQKGNTYMALRNITPGPLNGFGTTNQFQYFGLATPFRDLALTARLDFNHYAPVQVSLLGEFVTNLAFSSSRIAAQAVNNLGAAGAGSYVGGANAWLLGLRVGHPSLEAAGDWGAGLTWRRVESDAVVDGFADSDFGGGGTNLQGWSLNVAYALSRRVSVGVRWMSADSIAGPTFKNDTLQFDLNAKF
jgi:hypothetical protein